MWGVADAGVWWLILRNWGGLVLLIVVALVSPFGIGRAAKAPRIVLVLVVTLYLLLAVAGGVIAWLQW